MEELHSKVQHRFNKFLAGLPARRMAEHRVNLTLGQINNNYQIIEDAPGECHAVSPDTDMTVITDQVWRTMTPLTGAGTTLSR